jgi:hypothetical protein
VFIDNKGTKVFFKGVFFLFLLKETKKVHFLAHMTLCNPVYNFVTSPSTVDCSWYQRQPIVADYQTMVFLPLVGRDVTPAYRSNPLSVATFYNGNAGSGYGYRTQLGDFEYGGPRMRLPQITRTPVSYSYSRNFSAN